MRDENFGAELLDFYARLSAERMLAVNDERQLVGVDADGLELRRVRTKGDHAQFGVVIQQVVGNTACKGAQHGDSNSGGKPAELIQHREEIQTVKFICGDAQFAAIELPQFRQRALRLCPEVYHPLRILIHNLTSVGKGAVAGGAVEQSFAEFLLQFANGLADGRLAAM